MKPGKSPKTGAKAPLLLYDVAPCVAPFGCIVMYPAAKKLQKNCKSMATVRLYLDTRSKRADGTSAIRLAVNHHGKTAFITLGQYVKRDEWDKRVCRVKKRTDKDALNDFLLDRLNFYNRLLMQVQCKPDYRGNISAIRLRDMLLREADPNSCAVTLRDMFVRYTSREMREQTKRNYIATWRAVERFDKGAASLTLEDINRDWVERFNLYLLNNGIKHNTRTVKIRHLVAVYNYAIDNELTTNYPFRHLNLNMEQTRKRDLTVDELRTVFAAELPDKRKWVVDVFRIIFYLVGINIHDLYNLVPANLVNGRIEYVRLKTGKHYSILVHPELQQLLNAYRGNVKLFSFCERYKSASVLNIIVNRVLDTIRDGLTTYYARHTWATLAFKLGISKDTISLALGHSFGVRVTSTYINADLSKVDEANRKVLDYVLYGKE